MRFASGGREAIHLSFHHSTRLITSMITTETITQLIDGAWGSVCVSIEVLIKHLVIERKYSIMNIIIQNLYNSRTKRYGQETKPFPRGRL